METGFYKIIKTNQIIYLDQSDIESIDENNIEDAVIYYEDEELSLNAISYLIPEKIKFIDLFNLYLKNDVHTNYIISDKVSITYEMLKELIKTDNSYTITNMLNDQPKVVNYLYSLKKDIFIDSFNGVIFYIFTLCQDNEYTVEYLEEKLDKYMNHSLTKDDNLYDDEFINKFCYTYQGDEDFIRQTGLIKQISRYQNIVSIGIKRKLFYPVRNKAYDCYEGSKYTPRDTYQAEELLLILANDYGDEYAENTLGYIYYYYRKEDPQALLKSLAHFSIAKDQGVIEATYKVADIYSIRNDFYKNYHYAFSLVYTLLRSQYRHFSCGSINAKLPDVYLRLGSISRNIKLKNLKNANYYSLCNLYMAKSTIELRRRFSDYIGDNKVQDRINIIIDEIDKSSIDLNINNFDNIYDLMTVIYHQFTGMNYTSKIQIIDKNHLTLYLLPKTKFYIIPRVEDQCAKLYDSLQFTIEINDTSIIKKEYYEKLYLTSKFDKLYLAVMEYKDDDFDDKERYEVKKVTFNKDYGIKQERSILNIFSNYDSII